MSADEYLQWYYLIYLLPGSAAMLLLLLSVLSGGRHHRVGGGGHGHQAVSGHHSHAGMKHAPPGHGATVRPSVTRQALAFFGRGRVPAPLAWGSLLLGWGLFGFWATRLLQPALHVPALFSLPALGLAVLGALGASRLTAWVWTSLLPSEESFVTGTVDLYGLTGQVTYPVDASRGRVHVYDVHGTLHDVSAHVAPGRPAVARGRRVLVTDFDAAHGSVVVEEVP